MCRGDIFPFLGEDSAEQEDMQVLLNINMGYD